MSMSTICLHLKTFASSKIQPFNLVYILKQFNSIFSDRHNLVSCLYILGYSYVLESISKCTTQQGSP